MDDELENPLFVAETKIQELPIICADIFDELSATDTSKHGENVLVLVEQFFSSLSVIGQLMHEAIDELMPVVDSVAHPYKERFLRELEEMKETGLQKMVSKDDNLSESKNVDWERKRKVISDYLINRFREKS